MIFSKLKSGFPQPGVCIRKLTTFAAFLQKNLWCDKIERSTVWTEDKYFRDFSFEKLETTMDDECGEKFI